MLGDATPYWEMNLGDIFVREGTIAFEEAMNLGHPEKALTVMPGATLNFFSLGPTNPIVRTITVTNASITGGGSGHTNILNGPIVMDGGISLRPNYASLFFNGPLSGSATLTIGANPNPGTVYLNATNTYAGDTTVTNSTLAGNGSIAGNLVMAGGSLAPGMGVGMFTVNGSTTLAGLTTMELAPGQTRNSDTLNVGGALTFGGGLVVALAPDAAAPKSGDVYALFNKGGVGAFSTITLPSLPSGLNWITNTLATDGTIAVGGSLPQAAIGTIAMNESSLVLTGSGGTEGSTFYLLSSTNVAAPVAAWQLLATNTFGPGGTFNITNTISPAVSESFFRLLVP
jgi:hypothetical protein